MVSAALAAAIDGETQVNTKLLIAGVAIAALSCGAASAHTHHKKNSAANEYAEPSQPIPYAQLDNYLKATPRQRASMDFTNPAASTGTAANASASAGAPNDTSAAAGIDAAPNTSAGANMNPGAASSDMTAPTTSAPATGTAVNPPAADTTPPVMGATQPDTSTPK